MFIRKKLRGIVYGHFRSYQNFGKLTGIDPAWIGRLVACLGDPSADQARRIMDVIREVEPDATPAEVFLRTMAPEFGPGRDEATGLPLEVLEEGRA